MQDQPSWIGVILVLAFFGFMIFWIPFADGQLERKIRAAVGRRLGVKIVRDGGFGRGLQWHVDDNEQMKTGCWIALWEVITMFGIFIVPIFLALLLMGVLLFALSG